MKRKYLIITLSLMTCFNSSNVYAAYNTSQLGTDEILNETISVESVEEETELELETEPEEDEIQVEELYDSETAVENETIVESDYYFEPSVKEDYSVWIGRSEAEVREYFSDSAIYKYEITDSVAPGLVIRIDNEGENFVVYLSEEQLEVKEESVNNKINNENEASLLSHYELATCRTNPPAMSDNTWNGYPVSYEYNWDNSGGCWYYGMWGGNGKLQGYTCPENTYDTNVRHAMSLYCDGNYVYLHIIYASCYTDAGNGNDYNFSFDHANAKFRVVYADGSDLTSNKGEGTYHLKVVHENGSISGQDVIGSSGTMIVKQDNNNNEMEIKIPLDECARQNSMINTKSFSKVTFFTPNLMYRDISCGGAGNSALPFVLGTLVLFGTVSVLFANKKQKSKNGVREHVQDHKEI